MLWLGGRGGGGGFAAGWGWRPIVGGLFCPPGGGGGAGPSFLLLEIDGLALGVNDGFEFCWELRKTELNRECKMVTNINDHAVFFSKLFNLF